jgi:hypothetical protein
LSKEALMRLLNFRHRSHKVCDQHVSRAARAFAEPLETRTLLSAYTYTAAPVFQFASGTGIGSGTGGQLAIDSVGEVFGTGSTGNGTIWEESPNFPNTPLLVANFPADGSVGSNPIGVQVDSEDNLYGTVQQGFGVDGDSGGLWELPLFAAGVYVQTPVLLASFDNMQIPDNGIYVNPRSFDIFGTADSVSGGDSEIWEWKPGATAFTTLAEFTSGTGVHPSSTLVMDSTGNLWGTTADGGANSAGTLFELPFTNGSFSSTITTVASFGGADPGITPEGQLAIDGSNNILGITRGDTDIEPPSGTVWEWSAANQHLGALGNFDSFDAPLGEGGVLLSGANLYGLTSGLDTDSLNSEIWEVPNYATGGALTKLAPLDDYPGGAQLVLPNTTLVKTFSGTLIGGSGSELFQATANNSGAGGAAISTSVIGTTLASIFIPGDKASAKLTVTNDGSAAAHGVLDVQLYASTDGTLATATPLTATGLTKIPISLAAGKSRPVSGNFTVPTTLPAGTYSLIAVNSVVSGFTNAVVDTTPAVSPGTATEALSFGTVGARHGLHFVDVPAGGGKITFVLGGPGTGTFTPDGNGGYSLALTGTTAGSSLSIVASGAAALTGETLDSLQTDANIGVINAAKLDLTGTLSIQGSARLIIVRSVTDGLISLGGATPSILELGTLTDAPIISTDPLTLLQVSSFTNTLGVDPIIAPSITTFVDQGDFSAEVSATKIGTFTVKGNVTTSNVLAGTNFGPDDLPGGGDDTFAAGTINAIRIFGSIDSNSLLAAGLDNADDAFPLDATPTLLTGGKIGTIYVKGPLGDGSAIIAASVPKTAIINGVPVKTS